MIPFRPDLLKGKTVLITGGGTGLGRSMALAFAGLGANIAICGRREDVLQSTSKEITGVRCAYRVCDVRDAAAVDQMVAAFWKELGPLHVLVNNAAGNFICPTEALSPNGFDAVVKIVLYGSFNCTQAVGKRWIDAGQPGTVLSICTTYAWTGSAFVVPSACAKAGVLAMTQSLAVEWGRRHIRLNAIAPGPFKTEGAWKNLMPAGFEEKMMAKNPTGRLGNHEELANLAAFMVSDASPYLNGECVTIDGGEWLQGAGQFNGLLALTPQDWQGLQRTFARGSDK